MLTEVKICGLSDEEGVDAALESGADFVGFVFYPPSPRNVALGHAAGLAVRARGKASVTALTVDAEDALLVEIAGVLRPDFLQLHGEETPERVAAIQRLTGIRVIKALGVASRADLAAVERHAAADRFLLDAKPPRSATRPGGNASPFDWSLLRGFSPPRPWILAGGLTADNVVEALRATGAPGVDVSSGVEIAPGRKDPDLVRAFLAAVRNFDRPARQRAG